jgi:hypothetical protein
VNLLIYLVDQLLRGCQSADNQFQALQNQATESFSVYGSQLSGSTGFWCLEDFCSSLYQLFYKLLIFGLLADSSLLFLFVLNFRMFLSVDFIYTLFTLVLLRNQGGIFYYYGLSILFYPLSF